MKDGLNNINFKSIQQILKKNSRIIGFLKDWVMPIAIAFVLALCVNKFLIYNVSVPTSSMYPTIQIGDRLTIERVYNPSKIKRGDIIVFYSSELSDRLIKRVIGLPGDHIEINEGTVSINGDVIDEPYIQNNMNYTGTFDVPDDSFFFLGDNRSNSKDSRFWINSYIKSSDIKGKAILRFYPFSRIGSIK
ncbi:signal peptidase I [Clostridium sp. BJN0001]|uniref:signal peptidase I n=1 Tax=Clostridium sp. BJN0001 TaxID=2930219 RepID=UPI001FD32007|nr:signal peptidase I [Clostridium sp. BJN0001]